MNITEADKRIKELEEEIGVLKAHVKRLKEEQPPQIRWGDSNVDHVILQTDHYTVGVTEYPRGEWSSVWMKYASSEKRPAEVHICPKCQRVLDMGELFSGAWVFTGNVCQADECHYSTRRGLKPQINEFGRELDEMPKAGENMG